jgi:formiminotetrahydrofolate cyclodeaminase
MVRFSNEVSLRDFLSALAGADSSQDAVSAAAYAAGMGSALLARVAALPQTRADSIHDRTRLATSATALAEIEEQILEAIETESAVKLFAARSLPQASEAQRIERETAVQLALRAGTDVPLEVMRLCALGLKQAEIVVTHGCRAAATDMELAVALLRAAFDGARANLEGKLSVLTDVRYTTAVVDEIAGLAHEVTSAAQRAGLLLQQRPV